MHVAIKQLRLIQLLRYGRYHPKCVNLTKTQCKKMVSFECPVCKQVDDWKVNQAWLRLLLVMAHLSRLTSLLCAGQRQCGGRRGCAGQRDEAPEVRLVSKWQPHWSLMHVSKSTLSFLGSSPS